jgi:hypothetical protein
VDCNAASLKIHAKKLAFQSKFETVLKFENAKEIAKEAILILINQKKLKLTDGDCLVIWMNIGSICFNTCALTGGYDECYQAFVAAMMDTIFLCYLLAD